MVQSIYTNRISVIQSHSECVLKLTQMRPKVEEADKIVVEIQELADIVMTPAVFKNLHSAMGAQLKIYEKENGVIKV